MADMVAAAVHAPTPSEAVLGREMGGFNFSLKHRNEALVAASNSRLPRAMKTGTTICGLIYKDGVVLGADTRATEDTTISDKNCEKIHYIAPNIYCCGAGTAADTENVTLLISSQLELLRRATRTSSRVVSAMTMLKRRLFKYQGQISAALVLGGVDATGPHLYTIYPHGSTDKLPFVTMGSGSLAAMAVFESGFRDDMTREEAVALVSAATRAGIFNDLGSGSNVDICIIEAPSGDPAAGSGAPSAAAAAAPVVTYLRNIEKPNEVEPLRARITRPSGRVPPKGATVVLSEKFEPYRAPPAAARAAAAAPSAAGMDVDA